MYAVRKSLYFRFKVRNVNRSPLEQSFVANEAPSQASPLRPARWYRSEVRRKDHLITLAQADRRVIGPAYPSRALRNRVEHGLNIRRRTSDNTQDFTRRSLLFQRLFEFLKQSHILDGDHRLIGESLEKRDLLLGEGSNFCTANRNYSNRSSLSQQWRAKDRPSSSVLLEESRFWKLAVKFSRDVMDMDCRPVDHRPSCRIATMEAWRGRGWHGSIFCRTQPLQSISVNAVDSCVIRFT